VARGVEPGHHLPVRGAGSLQFPGAILHLAGQIDDRYLNSVIANHAVAATIAPLTGYLAVPDMTIYLHTSPAELARRMRAKPDQTRSDHDLLTDPALFQRLQDRYDQIASADPAARHLNTTGRAPDELASLITAMLPAAAILA
jgi:thymidylate kinase